MNRTAILVVLAALAAVHPYRGNLSAQTSKLKLPPASVPVENSASDKRTITFRKIMSSPSEYDDNFAHAVIAVSNEQKSLIARNYIVVGSSEQIVWLRNHPERRGNRLFGLNLPKDQLTRLPDSTNFGFVPNSTLAWLLFCDGTVRFWDTRTHKKRDVVFPHSLASECAGPNPAISPDGRIMATQTNDSLRLWDLRTLKAISPEVEHVWVRNMKFSSDGRWLFTRRRRELKILEPKTGKLVGGPFRHDLINDRFSYSAKGRRLATFENNDKKAATWKSAAVIRSGKNWSKSRRVELVGHAREANWIDDTHLLVVADNKRPGQRPPFTYGRKVVYLVSLATHTPVVQTRLRHTWISSARVAPDRKHFITTTRDGTSCWTLREEKPSWDKPGKYRVSFGDGDWVLLHRERTATLCSLATGKELWRREHVVASRLQGSDIWLCGEKGIEVWRAEKQQTE